MTIKETKKQNTRVRCVKNGYINISDITNIDTYVF